MAGVDGTIDGGVAAGGLASSCGGGGGSGSEFRRVRAGGGDGSGEGAAGAGSDCSSPDGTAVGGWCTPDGMAEDGGGRVGGGGGSGGGGACGCCGCDCGGGGGGGGGGGLFGGAARARELARAGGAGGDGGGGCSMVGGWNGAGGCAGADTHGVSLSSWSTSATSSSSLLPAPDAIGGAGEVSAARSLGAGASGVPGDGGGVPAPERDSLPSSSVTCASLSPSAAGRVAVKVDE